MKGPRLGVLHVLVTREPDRPDLGLLAGRRWRSRDRFVDGAGLYSGAHPVGLRMEWHLHPMWIRNCWGE